MAGMDHGKMMGHMNNDNMNHGEMGNMQHGNMGNMKHGGSFDFHNANRINGQAFDNPGHQDGSVSRLKT